MFQKIVSSVFFAAFGVLWAVNETRPEKNRTVLIALLCTGIGSFLLYVLFVLDFFRVIII